MLTNFRFTGKLKLKLNIIVMVIVRETSIIKWVTELTEAATGGVLKNRRF